MRPRSLSVLLCSGVLIAPLFGAPSEARAEAARLLGLGDQIYFLEDSANVYTNPALLALHSDRVWFSVGVSGGNGSVVVAPHGGGAVTIRDVLSLGVVLNRAPTDFGFTDAMWPVLGEYIPGGPGGVLSGPEGPSETTARLRFPVDVFAAVGDRYSRLRVGLNLYYAGGVESDWSVEDVNEDGFESRSTVNRQSHLFNATLGVSGGAITARVRPEAWLRIGNLAAWHDEVVERDAADGTVDTSVDRILSLDRDLRVGAGLRVQVGDAAAGLVVTPALKYDVAFGSFRFDDNRANPDSDAEKALRETHAHDLRGGVGLAYRRDALLVQGSAAIWARNVTRTDQTAAPAGAVDGFVESRWNLGVPELALGAEYTIRGVVVVRGGLRTVFGAGKEIVTTRVSSGPETTPPDQRYESEVVRTLRDLDTAQSLTATTGIGVTAGVFRFDAIVGGVFLGAPGPLLFSRFDLQFVFD